MASPRRSLPASRQLNAAWCAPRGSISPQYAGCAPSSAAAGALPLRRCADARAVLDGALAVGREPPLVVVRGRVAPRTGKAALPRVVDDTPAPKVLRERLHYRTLYTRGHYFGLLSGASSVPVREVLARYAT